MYYMHFIPRDRLQTSGIESSLRIWLFQVSLYLEEGMAHVNILVNIYWMHASMQIELISCFSFLGHGVILLSIVAPLNHAANLCSLFQMWQFKAGEVHRWRYLDYKLETHPQLWLVVFKGSRLVLIIMCSCRLSTVNFWLSCKHFHWADFLIEQISHVEYCVKTRIYYTAISGSRHNTGKLCELR